MINSWLHGLQRLRQLIGRLGLRMAVWLQAKVCERGLKLRRRLYAVFVCDAQHLCICRIVCLYLYVFFRKETTLWANCPLWVSQLSQLSLPPLWVCKWVVIHGLHVNYGGLDLRRQTRPYMAADQSPWAQALLLPRMYAGSVCVAQRRCSCSMRLLALYY